MNFFKTFAAVRLGGLHKVALPAEQFIAVETGEMVHVPAAALRLGALIREYDLVTSGTTGFEQLGMVAPAINLGVVAVKKVDEIHQQFVACVAQKAGRVPAGLRSCTTCKYSN